jgi:hypothetical protein
MLSVFPGRFFDQASMLLQVAEEVEGFLAREKATAHGLGVKNL